MQPEHTQHIHHCSLWAWDLSLPGHLTSAVLYLLTNTQGLITSTPQTHTKGSCTGAVPGRGVWVSPEVPGFGWGCGMLCAGGRGANHCAQPSSQPGHKGCCRAWQTGQAPLEVQSFAWVPDRLSKCSVLAPASAQRGKCDNVGVFRGG